MQRRRVPVPFASSTMIALVGALVMTACGSTVDPAQVGSVDVQDEGLALEEPLPSDSPSGPGTEPDSPTAVPREQSDSTSETGAGERPSSSDTTAEPSPTNQPQVGEAPPGPSAGQGFTPHEIFIGVVYNSSFEQQAAAAGANATAGDQRSQAQTLADAINSDGGIAGRKIVLVFYDTRGEQDDRNATQAACVRFTEDEPVFAAMSVVSQVSNETFFECLGRRGVVTLGGVLGGGFDSLERFSRYPHLYLPVGPSIERLAPVWVQRLAANDYFTGWNTSLGRAAGGEAQVGLLYGANGDVSRPVAEALREGVERELAQQGRSLSAAFLSTGAANEMNQAVLRFRQAGVTHIIGDAALIPFLPAAAAQNYRPRFGFASMSGPALMSLVATPGQLNGALGVGFSPPMDVDNARDPGDVSPAQTECRQMMDDAGQPTSERLAWAVMALMCDAFSFVVGAVEQGELSPEGFRAGVERMRTLEPSSTFRVSFPGGRADGAAAVRDMEYGGNCGCFRYLSATNHDM